MTRSRIYENIVYSHIYDMYQISIDIIFIYVSYCLKMMKSKNINVILDTK